MWQEFQLGEVPAALVKAYGELSTLRTEVSALKNDKAYLESVCRRQSKGIDDQAKEVSALKHELEEARRAATAWHKECDEVGQALGKALGYPWYKDDQLNFPGSNEQDGVCIGEHVAGTIALEAAQRLSTCQDRIARLTEALLYRMTEPVCNKEWSPTHYRCNCGGTGLLRDAIKHKPDCILAGKGGA